MMNLLIEELKVQNYTQEEIDKITHKNVLRVFKENFTKSNLYNRGL